MRTVAGGRRGRALGLKKICNCFFSTAASLAGSAALRAASSTIKRVALLPWPRRGFAGGSWAPKK